MSEYNQTSFLGGMNLLSDDTRLQPTQYRLGFNLRNRYDILDEVPNSTLDTSLPAGNIQEIVTFGNYLIAFVSGAAYYRLYSSEGWQQIFGFKMDSGAYRYWTCSVPLATTNYVRVSSPTNVSDGVPTGSISVGNSSTAVTGAGTFFTTQIAVGTTLTKIDGTYIGTVASITYDTSLTLVNNNTAGALSNVGYRILNTQIDARSNAHQLSILSGAAGGNLPGLLVQDNINQPQFIYLDNRGYPVVRVTQTYSQWNVVYNIATGAMTTDSREYVPVGNTMSFVDGILYIASQDGSTIYRSVSGRPLDFVINVQINGSKGGDATTTSYSVGSGNISCLRGMADGSLFVASGNSNFSVSKNYGNNCPLMFGEFLFIRKFLFEATCLNDRCIIDSLGDTRFIDLTGVRSFNSINQLMNEGRNSQFTASVQLAFKGVVQDTAAAIYYDNYEYYAVNTIFGPAILVYDTISQCWSSFDTTQTNGKKIKQFAKIELGVQRLFAITEDNQLYTLYAGSTYTTAILLTGSVNASVVQGEQNVRLNNARSEIKPLEFRCILNKITQNSTLSLTPLIDNRVSSNVPTITKTITYSSPITSYAGILPLPDVDKQLTNIYIPLPNCEQGWKAAMILSWTGGGSIVQFSMNLKDETPLNPLKTQGNTK